MARNGSDGRMLAFTTPSWSCGRSTLTEARIARCDEAYSGRFRLRRAPSNDVSMARDRDRAGGWDGGGGGGHGNSRQDGPDEPQGAGRTEGRSKGDRPRWPAGRHRGGQEGRPLVASDDGPHLPPPGGGVRHRLRGPG